MIFDNPRANLASFINMKLLLFTALIATVTVRLFASNPHYENLDKIDLASQSLLAEVFFEAWAPCEG